MIVLYFISYNPPSFPYYALTSAWPRGEDLLVAGPHLLTDLPYRVNIWEEVASEIVLWKHIHNIKCIILLIFKHTILFTGIKCVHILSNYHQYQWPELHHLRLKLYPLNNNVLLPLPLGPWQYFTLPIFYFLSLWIQVNFERSYQVKNNRCLRMIGIIKYPSNIFITSYILYSECLQQNNLIVRLLMAFKDEYITQISFRGHNDVWRINWLNWISNNCARENSNRAQDFTHYTPSA